MENEVFAQDLLRKTFCARPFLTEDKTT